MLNLAAIRPLYPELSTYRQLMIALRYERCEITLAERDALLAKATTPC